MKNTRYFLLLLLLFLVLPVLSHAQTAEKDSSLILGVLTDKAYLSFDKPYYTAGETMYFKAFLADAISHKPDTFTTVLYVDFIETSTKRTIAQQKIKIERGHAAGSFLTEGVKEGVFVHAYTRWMGNIAADYHFNKTIQIFEPKDPNALAIAKKEPKKKVITPAVKLEVPEVNNDAIKKELDAVNNNQKKIKLQFFPESGNLLVGFANRIAFKATDETGKGVAVKGVIKNETGEELTAFEDSFLGMGRFSLVQKENEKYTAYIKNEDGTTTDFSLPKGQTKNAAMVVDNLNDTADIKVVLYFSFDSASMPNMFTILAHQRGKVCFNSNVKVKNKNTLRILKVTIPRKNFTEEGIATITLMNDLGKPLAERLVFIRNNKRKFNVNLTTNKAVFDKRERVTVEIETKTPDGKPVAADLSFAVTNDSKISSPTYSEDLRAYMLLRSDLRGYIESPSYYFEDTTAKARLALDNLLMTQGWRRFNWDGKKDSLRYEFEQGLTVDAIVRRKKAPVSDAQILVFLTRNDSRTQSGMGKTDAKGHLILDNLDFTDSAQLYVNIANSGKTHTVEQQLPLRVPSVSEPEIYLADQPSGNLETYLDGSQAVLLSQKMRTEREIMLQEFEVKAKKKDAFEGDSRINSNMVDRSYVIDENDQGSVISYLQSRSIKVERTNTGDVVLMHNRGAISNGNFGLVVDGFSQNDGYILNSLFMNDIQRIDIINNGDGGYMLGSTIDENGNSQRPNGVVHILTKSGDPNYYKKYGRRLDSDIPVLLLAGYTSQKQFYTPDYSINRPEYAESDRRTTLFWSPNVHTDATGKTKISFYTTDDAHTARILVEGIDGTGKIGVAKGVFKVKSEKRKVKSEKRKVKNEK